MRPTQIKLHTESQILELSYKDGSTAELSAEFLRVHSPSAEVQGHSAAEARLVDGKQLVKITEVTAQGNYAIRLRFSDTHDSGIYSWTYLHQIATNKEKLWKEYLLKLESEGKSRTPHLIASSNNP